MTTNPTAHHRYLADDDEFEEYTPIGLDGLLASTEKLLAINRGIAEPDERDSLPNDRVYTVDKLMAERVKLDHGKTLRTLVGRLSRQKNLSALHTGALSPYTVGYLQGNPLAPALEEINPMHILEQKRRITKMGPGGIGDPNAITLDMQAVNASQFGFIDPVSGPECMPGDHEVFTSVGWIRWDRIVGDEEFLCRVDGQTRWCQPTRVVRERYIGDMLHVQTPEVRMVVTPTHRVVITSVDRGESILPAFRVFGLSFGLVSGASESDLRRLYVTTDDWSRGDYDGMVYCATVPGGQMYVRGSETTSGYWTGNSERAGIDIRLATGTRIGSDGKVYQVMIDRKTGKKRWVSPVDLVGKTLKLPD